MVRKNMINLYNASNIDSLAWPDTEEGNYAKNYFIPLLKEGVQSYIENVKTDLSILKVNEFILPITINDEEYENSFICSPYTQYISSGFLFIDTLKNKLLKNTLNTLVKIFGKVLRFGKINRVITVNNWLMTANPPLIIDDQTLEILKDYLIQHFPYHAILFRSVVKKTCEHSFNALKNQKFHLLATRLVYITQASNEKIFKTRIFKSDLKFFKESHYDILKASDIPNTDIPKIQELYNALYIKKHSQYNPQYNLRFVKHVFDNEVFHFQALKHNNSLKGVIGYFCHKGSMISSFFGYDPSTSEQGIYRLLSTMLMLEAQKKSFPYYQGAGGSFYKKIRKAEGHLEYTAIYSRHLSIKRRFIWQILKISLNSFGIHFMKKY
jgi:hypothetical protein